MKARRRQASDCYACNSITAIYIFLFFFFLLVQKENKKDPENDNTARFRYALVGLQCYCDFN